MTQLREDIRAHPLATLLLLGGWCISTWLVAIIGINPIGIYVLLLPSAVAGYLLGRARRERKATAPGIVAALVIALVLLYLSLGLLTLAGRGGTPGTLPSGQWAAFGARIFLAGLVAPYGLVAGAAGWAVGGLRWRSGVRSSPH